LFETELQLQQGRNELLNQPRYRVTTSHEATNYHRQ